MVIFSRVQTPDGTVIWSRYRHDMQCHTDANGTEYCLDGGPCYRKISVLGEGSVSDLKDVSLTSESPHSDLRFVKFWGTRGPKGNEKLRVISASEMSDDHLANILKIQLISRPIRFLLEQEASYRLV